MIIWLIVVAALLLFWGAMWKNYTKLAIGVLIGMPIGWLFSKVAQTYLTGDMHDLPLWLPPLPFALVAILLLVVGIIIWVRPDDSGRSAGP